MSAQIDSLRPAHWRRTTTTLRGASHSPLLPLLLLTALVLGSIGLAAWMGTGIPSPQQHSVTEAAANTTLPNASPSGKPLFKATGPVGPSPAPIQVIALTTDILDKLFVVEDQTVNAGEAVTELIKDEACHACKRALAELELREAELEEAETALTSASSRLKHPVHLEVALAEADADLAAIETQLGDIPFEVRHAESQLAFCKRNYERKSALEGVVAGRAIDEARNALTEATVSLEEQRAHGDSLRKEKEALVAYRDAMRTQLELTTTEGLAEKEARLRVRVAQARVEQANISLAEAQLRLDRLP
jgi:HlyD family secretion protein